MRVSRFGNSLAVRLPASLVETLELKYGDDVELVPVGDKRLGVARKPDLNEVVAQLRSLREKLPPDFPFESLVGSEQTRRR
jgi:antitoxin MazE